MCSSDLIRSNEPITYICPHCNLSVIIKHANNLYKQEIYGCRSCFLEKKNIDRSEKSKTKIIEKIRKIGNIEILNIDKDNSENKLIFTLKCQKCNHEWTVLGNNINRDKWKGCPECWKSSADAKLARAKGREIFTASAQKYTKNKLLNWLKSNDVTILSENFKFSTSTSIKIRCDICEYEWSTNIGHILKGNGDCPGCNGTRYSTKTFTQKLEELRRYDLKMIGEYIPYGKSIFQCAECDYIWEALPSSIIRGTGCPKCKLSKGERYISQILDCCEVRYEVQKVFADCINSNHLPFDFYLPDYNLLIEYDGMQHFEPIDFFGGKEHFLYRKQNDNIKNQYCKENNMPLLRIPYWEFDNIEQILEEWLHRHGVLQKNKKIA